MYDENSLHQIASICVKEKPKSSRGYQDIINLPYPIFVNSFIDNL